MIAPQIAKHGARVIPPMVRMSGERAFYLFFTGGQEVVQPFHMNHDLLFHSSRVILKVKDPRAIPMLKKILNDRLLGDYALSSLLVLRAGFTKNEVLAMISLQPYRVRSVVASLPQEDGTRILFDLLRPWEAEVFTMQDHFAGICSLSEKEQAVIQHLVGMVAELKAKNAFDPMRKQAEDLAYRYLEIEEKLKSDSITASEKESYEKCHGLIRLILEDYKKALIALQAASR